MARRAKIDIVGDATQFAKAVREGTVLAGDLAKAFTELQTDAQKTAEATAQASAKTEARLRTQARIARQLAEESKADAYVRQFYLNQAEQKERQLAKVLGVTGEAERASIQKTSVARLESAVTLQSYATKQAEEYRQMAAVATLAAQDETKSAAEREAAQKRAAIATKLAAQSDLEAAKALQLTRAEERAAAGASGELAATQEKAAAAAKAEAAAQMTDAEKTRAAAEAKQTLIQGLRKQRSLLQETVKAEGETSAAAAALVDVETKLAAQFDQTRKQMLAQEQAAVDLAAGTAKVSAANKTEAQTSIESARAALEASKQKIRAAEAELAARRRVLATLVAGSEDAKIQQAAVRQAEAQLAGLQKKLGVTTPVNTRSAESMIKARLEEQALIRQEIVDLKQLTTADNVSASERGAAQELLNEKTAEYMRLLGASRSQIRLASREQIEADAAVRTQLEKEIAQYKAVLTAGTTSAEARKAATEDLALAEASLTRQLQAQTFASEAAVQHTKDMERNTNKAFRGVLAGSGLFKELGRSLAFASSGFLLFAVGSSQVRSSLEKAVELQKQMELLHTQAGATKQEMTAMTGAVLRLAPALGTKPDELAKGLYHIESAGLAGKQALDALKVAAKGAIIGNADLEDTSTALIATWKSGIRGVHSFASAMEAANAIVGSGNMRMSDLVKALSTPLLSTAKQAGLSISEIGAALDTLTIAWGPNSNAATRLAMSINLLAAPTAQAQKELKGIGLSATSLGDTMRSKGLIPALELLKSKMKEQGLTATQQGLLLTRAFGGGKSSGAVKTLIQFLDTLGNREQKIASQTGTLGEKWNATVHTAEFATKRWHAAMAALQAGLGATLLPALTHTSNAFADWLSKEKNQQSIQKDFNDGIQITVGLLKTLKDVASPLVHIFQGIGDAMGGTRREVELLVAAFVGWKMVGGANLMAIGTRFKEIGTDVGLVEGQLKLATVETSRLSYAMTELGASIMANSRQIGLMTGVLAPAIKNIPGLNNTFGSGLSKVLSDAGFGLFAGSLVPGKFGRQAKFLGAGLGVGMGLKSAIGGRTGDFIGNIAGGATAGFAFGPEGALAGAALGLTKSFLDLMHGAESAADKLKDLGKKTVADRFAVARGALGISKQRDVLAEMRVSRDQAADRLKEARAAVRAAKGTNQYREAVDTLRYAQRSYNAAVRQLRAAQGSLGTMMVNQRKNILQQKQDQKDTAAQFLKTAQAARSSAQTVYAWGERGARAFRSSEDAASKFADNMDNLAKTLPPKLAAVAQQLADVARQTKNIPSNKTIKLTLEMGIVYVPGKGFSTPHAGQQARGDRFPSIDLTGLPIPKNLGGKSAPTKHPPIRSFSAQNIPFALRKEEAGAMNQAQDVKAAKDILAWVNKQIASGRLVGDALIAALQLRRQEHDAIDNAVNKAKKAASSTSISKLVDPKIREAIARERAAGDKFGLVKELRAEITWIKNKIQSGNVTTSQKAALENEIARSKKEIAATLKKSLKDNWEVPLALQLQEAKAGATATNLNDDLNVARKIKAAAQKALKSGKLGIKAQIDAWNAISNANSQLASSTVKALNQYHTVSTRALASQLHLQGAEKAKFESLMAEAMMHHGMLPNSSALNGATVNAGTGGDNYVFHITSTDPKQAAKEIEEILRKRRKRNAAQKRGRHSGHSLGMT